MKLIFLIIECRRHDQHQQLYNNIGATWHYFHTVEWAFQTIDQRLSVNIIATEPMFSRSRNHFLNNETAKFHRHETPIHCSDIFLNNQDGNDHERKRKKANRLAVHLRISLSRILKQSTVIKIETFFSSGGMIIDEILASSATCGVQTTVAYLPSLEVKKSRIAGRKERVNVKDAFEYHKDQNRVKRQREYIIQSSWIADTSEDTINHQQLRSQNVVAVICKYNFINL